MLAALRALVWLGVSTGLLLAGYSALAGLLLLQALISRGEMPGDVQMTALGIVFSAVASESLLPELALTWVTWLALARLVPALERRKSLLALGLFGVGAAWFPVVGHWCFAMWTPTSPSDYAFTLLLVAGGAALALLLPRLVSPALSPGCFTPGPKRGIVNPS
jgi:hypothetical protein